MIFIFAKSTSAGFEPANLMVENDGQLLAAVQVVLVALLGREGLVVVTIPGPVEVKKRSRTSNGTSNISLSTHFTESTIHRKIKASPTLSYIQK